MTITFSEHEYPTPEVAHHLNKMLDRLFVAHRQFNEADAEHVRAAYAARWELLNELEEFLGDACVELAP
jgi:hypothetical protein